MCSNMESQVYSLSLNLAVGVNIYLNIDERQMTECKFKHFSNSPNSHVFGGYPTPAKNSINLKEFACLTTVILAPLRVEAGLHAHSATSLPEAPVAPVAPVASYRSTFFIVLLAPRGPFLRQIEVFG